MKFKKAFAVILAVAMVITLMPSMAFAATTNTVTEVLSVEADDTMPLVQLNLKASGNDAVGGIFDITLDNAKFDVEASALNANAIYDSVGAVSTGAINKTNGYAIGVAVQTSSGAVATVPATAPAILAIDETSVRIDTKGTISEDEYYVVYLNLKSGTEEGAVSVSLTNVSAKISNGTYTVATVGTTGTVATVVGTTIKQLSSDSSARECNQIKISETAVNSVNDKDENYQAIKLTLPKYYEWNKNTAIGGDMLAASGTTLGAFTEIDGSTTMAAVNAMATGGTGFYYALSNDNRVLTIYFNSKNAAHQEILTIAPVVNVDADAATGDVTVSISNVKGDISGASGLVIAKNVEEGVEVKTFSEITTVQNGLMEKNGETTPYYVFVQLKENVATALSQNRTVTFDFPEEVQVVGAPEMTASSSASRTSSYSTNAAISYKATSDKDASGFTWTTNGVNIGTKETYTFKVPVSVEAGFTGDIDVTVSGAKAGIEEQTVTVGTAVAPIAIETNVTAVKTGIQNQAVADILIKETDKGMLQKDRDLTLYIKDAPVFVKGATVEVIEGDLEITGDSSANIIKFTIKSESTEASTIKISGLKVTLDRTYPEGGYNLRAAGDALVDNDGCRKNDFQDYSVQVADYINIVTPADSVTVSEKVDAKFVIGEASYTNNGEATEMDAAAYIDKNNRTMVPIRYVANACGISENDIRWDQNTQTAIINGLNTVVTVKMGSNKLQTSTGEITMDTVAVNNNGRIYVPVRYIANALGANVSWDAATKTVTLTK